MAEGIDGGRLVLHMAYACPDTRPTYDLRSALPAATLHKLEAAGLEGLVPENAAMGWDFSLPQAA